MMKFGYSPKLASGAVAAGGTLGSLIPPSILFILYGVFTEISVSRLFISGIIPGIMTLVGYLIVTLVWARRFPEDAPARADHTTLGEKMNAAARAWPLLALFFLVVGGLYFGVFTPTESAAAGAVLTGVAGWALKRLSWQTMLESFSETVSQTATIFSIAIGAKVFISFTALTAIPTRLLENITTLGLSAGMVLMILVLLYIVLGMFLDSIGILLLTLPLVTPVVESLNLDLLWFGVIVVKLLEIGLITPPIGLNVFVIKSAVGDRMPLETIFHGIMAFLISDVIVLGLLLAFPLLSQWLPNLMN